MVMNVFFRALLLILIALSSFAFAEDSQIIVREDESQFPRCLVRPGEKNLFFKWDNHTLTRVIQVSTSKKDCSQWKSRLSNKFIGWKKLNEDGFNSLPLRLRQDLEQVKAKGNILREDLTAEDFVKNQNIQSYTKELNRDITADYGQIFSAQVFKAWIESKAENKDLRTTILATIRKNVGKEVSLPELKDKITLVVSFGLGWKESYSKLTPYYISEFISDMKSLGMPVVFLKKNAWGTINNNIQEIIPELTDVLNQGKDIIFVSLCKGTPEILAAESEIMRNQKAPNMGRILGHVNLSGMLSGTFFADVTNSVLVPRLIAPVLKILPLNASQEMAKMIDAVKFIDSKTVENVVNEAGQSLQPETFYINITGAPMSDRVLHQNSPMAAVIKYNFVVKALRSASDGFIELPNTLIPEKFSSNQATLVLDSSHLLADGYLDEFWLKEEASRRALYYSIVKYISARYPDLQEAKK